MDERATRLLNPEQKQEKFEIEDLFMPFRILQDKDLTLAEKFYLAIYEQTREIKRADRWMSSMYSDSHILSIKKRLSELNKIQINSFSSPEKAKEFVIQNQNKGQKCEWCNQRCYILHQHHFPLLQSEGGTQVVNICPNCHATFHSVYKKGENYGIIKK